MKPAVLIAIFCLLCGSSAVSQTASTVSINANASFGIIDVDAGASYPNGCIVGQDESWGMNIELPMSQCSVLFDNGLECDTYSGDGSASYFVLPGSYTVTATWSGYYGSDGSGNACSIASASASQTVVVPFGVTTTTVQGSPQPVQAGQPLSLIVTVSTNDSFEVNGYLTLPGGQANLVYGAQTVASALVEYDNNQDYSYSTATITVPTKGFPPGTYKASVNYSGDPAYTASSSGPFDIVIEAAQQSTNTTLTAAPTPLVAGQNIAIGVAVTPTGNVPPTGTVTLLAGSATLGTIKLANGSGAVIVPANVPAGTYSLVAVYGGDQFNLPSTSAAVQVQVVAESPTTTALAASPNPVVEGQSVALTATVTPQDGNGTPTGTITLTANGQPLGKLALSHSAATLNASTAGLVPGTYSVVANYSGDSKDESSASTPLSVVLTAASKLMLAAAPNPVAKGSITTLTATVTNGQGAPVTSGTITFSYSGGTLGTAQLNSSGVAQLPLGTSAFAQGTYTMQASYPGSPSVPAASGSVSLVVN
jgi:hypothetical protein